jgi:hypothetical protein
MKAAKFDDGENTIDELDAAQALCIIRSMPHTESGRCRTPSPEHAAHRIRSMSHS